MLVLVCSVLMHPSREGLCVCCFQEEEIDPEDVLFNRGMATKIQRVYRGWSTRQQLQEQLAQHRHLSKYAGPAPTITREFAILRHAAALIIQSAWRSGAWYYVKGWCLGLSDRLVLRSGWQAGAAVLRRVDAWVTVEGWCLDLGGGLVLRSVWSSGTPPPPLRKHRLVYALGPGLTVVFLTTVFMVRSLAERDCVSIVEGNRGCVMFWMSPPAHNNILLATATHCCLF